VPLSNEKKNAHPKLGKWFTFKFWNGCCCSVHTRSSIRRSQLRSRWHDSLQTFRGLT
jgi:hypothetical protein